MTFRRRILAIATLAGFGLAAVATAQSRARVWGIITDEAGEPIPGVKVTVTDIEEGGLVRAEQTTNKKGRYTVALLDATRPYVFLFEKEGFTSIEEEIKVTILSNTRRDFTLRQGSGVEVGGGAPAAGGGGGGGGGGAAGLYNEGVLAFQQGDFETSRAKFEAAIEKDEDFGLAYSALARVAFREENWDEARSLSETALAFDEQDQVALSILYQTFDKLGMEKESKETYRRLETLLEPAVAAFNVGAEAYQVGQKDVAKAQFLKALELDPELEPAQRALAQVYSEEGSWAEAAAAAERALELEPGDKTALNLRYRAYQQLGDEAKAASALQALVQEDPQRVAGQWYEQAVQLFNGGQIAEAKAIFEQVLTIAPDHARSHYMLGLSAVNAGENDSAKEHFGRFLELTPDDPDAGTAREMLKYLE